MVLRKDIKIGIIGGGFAGPVTALELYQRGFADVTLFEESADMQNKGFGIGLAGNGNFLLSKLGITINDMPSAMKLESMESYARDGKRMFELPISMSQVHLSYIISREDLHKTLIRKLRESTVQIIPSTRVTNVVHVGEQEKLVFKDGDEKVFDCVVGAGGINSVTRTTLYCHSSQKFSNWATWWFWGKGEIDFTVPHSYIGPEITLGVFPLKDGRHFFTGYTYGTPDAVLRSDNSTLRSYLSNKLEVYKNIDAVIKSALMADEYMACRTSMINVRQSYCGSSILIGDAEHAFSPLLGLGTSLAIEDAHVLARELERGVNKNLSIKEAFMTYDKVRKSRILSVQIMSGMLWKMMNIKYGWQQIYQRIFSFFTPKWFMKYMYKRVITRDL